MHIQIQCGSHGSMSKYFGQGLGIEAMFHPATGKLMPESMDFNGEFHRFSAMLHICVGLPAAPCIWQFQTKYMRSHLYENVSHKTAACLATEFPCWNVLSSADRYTEWFLGFFQCPDWRSDPDFDADHSTLYADFVLGEIHIFPAQAAEFAYTDAGMHAKQQTKMKIADIVNKKFLQLVIVCKLHNLHLLAGASQMGVADWFTGIDASLCCKVQNAAEYA